MAVDKDMVVTDEIVDELLEDWLERDGKAFTHIRKEGKLDWESTLEEGSAYSSYYLECADEAELIKRAYPLARDMITSMDIPYKVKVIIHNGEDSFTDFQKVQVSTIMLTDKALTVGERLDVFLGTTVHEGCHLLYTNKERLTSIGNRIISRLFNILEDERIEKLCGDLKPGFARFLERSKYYWFDSYYLDYVAPKKEKSELNDFEVLLNLILEIVRYPKYIDEAEIVKYAPYLVEIKKVLLPYPVTTKETVLAAYKVFDILKEFYKDKLEEEMKEDSASGGGLSGVEVEKRMASDSSDILDKLDRSMPDRMDDSKIADAVKKDRGLLGDVCEGTVDMGGTKDAFFKFPPTNEERYKESLARVKRYAPAISKVIRCHCKEYQYIHRSMRSGMLDTSKLAEAVQGVPTVYIRQGEVRTDGVSVGVLIDESGSMCGGRIEAARDTAILINEALGDSPKVELFIYGHSGDSRFDGATELMIYREKTFKPRYSLGSVEARCENRDGIAILETAQRIRKQTQNHVLLFVLSDGEPSASRYRGSKAIEHTKECVDKVEKMDFTVIQVCINMCYDPKTMFKHWVVLEDMSNLAFSLGKVIKKATLSVAKVHVL